LADQQARRSRKKEYIMNRPEGTFATRQIRVERRLPLRTVKWLNEGTRGQSAEAIDLARRKHMIRKARAMWHGTGRAGNGSLSSDSGVLVDTPYSFRTRFENEKGTNPEELIAAAHAGCFTMALAFGLQAAGFTPTELSTEAAVTLDQDGQAFRISRSALTLRAKVPNLDDAAFARIAGEAEKNCPVSKVLNATVTLDAKLVP
jgi:osmotically inducible protein OsmC